MKKNIHLYFKLNYLGQIHRSLNKDKTNWNVKGKDCLSKEC